MALSAGARNNVPLHRIYGTTLSPDKRWYCLSGQLVDRKISQFVKAKFFELFPSEIYRVQVSDLWRENGEHVPKHWFSERTKNVNEAYGITLFGLCRGLIKQSSSTCGGFLSSNVCKRVVETINNDDIEEICDASLPGPGGAQALDRTPKSRRIEVLEGELAFYRGKFRAIESSIMAATLETPPNTPAVGSQVADFSPPRSIESIASSTSVGPINKKRQLKLVCSNALEQLTNASSHGSLGSVLAYGFLYGTEEDQQLVKSAIS